MTVTVFVICLSLIAISYVGGVAVGWHIKKSLILSVRKQPQSEKRKGPNRMRGR
jgi:hypothetical protein